MRNVKSATPGLALLAAYVFNDEIPDSDVEDAIALFNTTIRFLKLDELPYQSFMNVAAGLIENGSVDEDELKVLIADNLRIRKSIQHSDTLAELITLLKNISSLMNGNEKAFELVDKNLCVVNNQSLNILFPTRNDFRSYVRQNSVRINGNLVIPFNPFLSDKITEKYPHNFNGYIDELGNLYTIFGKRINGIPLNSVITMNPNYTRKDDTHVFVAKPENAVSSVYYYTIDFKKQSTTDKFKAVKKLALDIGGIRSKWLRILNNKEPQFEEAMILELIYQIQARIGSTSNKTLDKRTNEYLRTYGISTLLCKHVEIVHPIKTKSVSKKDIEIHFKYPGKAAFKGDVIHYQEHVFISERVNKVIVEWFQDRLKGRLNTVGMTKGQRKLLKDTSPEARLFSTNADKVRALFSELGAQDGVSVHKLRTLKGTMMMSDKIRKHPFTNTSPSQTKVTKWLREEALQVGIQLGHMSGEKYTAATAIAHYIDPVLMRKLYKDLNLVIPKTFANL